jgi:hypothetical protein
VIEELRNLHGVTDLLAIAGIPRASYYKWRAIRSLRTEKRTRDQEMREPGSLLGNYPNVTMLNLSWIRSISGQVKETSLKPCSIRIKASSIRLKRTTHDWKHSASKAATLAKQPA